jgi:two-component system nitrate/nitrite response regulator NarL
MLAHGASNKEIARVLNLSESTIKIHVRILRKLNIAKRVQLPYAVARGPFNPVSAIW